jgi:hypothetical protein
VSIDHSAAALDAALRAFGESLGRALSEGITRGLQEGLSRSLDLEELGGSVPSRVAEGRSLSPSPARRGGRPRGESRACRVSGCPDPARSRGLCSRHYQQELRREKSALPSTVATAPAPSVSVEARPPIVRRREPEAVGGAPVAPTQTVSVETAFEHIRHEEPRSPIAAAKRIFG